jgi:hypothetical protein
MLQNSKSIVEHAFEHSEITLISIEDNSISN